MSRKTMHHEFPLVDEPATQTAQPDPGDGADDGVRSRSARPSRWQSSEALFRRPPHGHVVGHAVGQPQIESFAGCPHGHVVGHAVGQPQIESFAGRPHGHVVGHAVGQPQIESFAGRPHGHIVGHAVGQTAWA